jgi:hypothetical protein
MSLEVEPVEERSGAIGNCLQTRSPGSRPTLLASP